VFSWRGSGNIFEALIDWLIFLNRMDFRPEETIFRFLFVSPAWFVGETLDPAFALTVVFPSFDGHARFDHQGPYVRSRFMLSVEVPVQEKKHGVVVHTFGWVGDEVSALLGGLFGKLIVNLGQIQAGQFITVPRAWDGRCDSYAHPAFNAEQRKPNGSPLNLVQAKALLEAYLKGARTDELGFLVRACEFYRMALENYTERPEMAFTLFISTLESLVELCDYSETDLYDAKLLEDLKVIEAHCPNGAKLAAGFKSRLFQVKRKVATLVNEFVPDSFFTQREGTAPCGFVQDRPELATRIRAAYDIRSRLLHTGNRSGIAHIASEYQGCEVILGRPVLPDEGLVKMLCASLNLTGLERVTSTVLRSLISQYLAGNAAAPV
jgi:hypothetical protein